VFVEYTKPDAAKDNALAVLAPARFGRRVKSTSTR
jgi:hypothetical protein